MIAPARCVALAVLLTACNGCRRETTVDAGVDGGDAPGADVSDAGEVDAAIGPPPAPLLVWTRGVDEPCAELMTPQFREAVPAAMPGHRRWTRARVAFAPAPATPPSFAGDQSYWVNRDDYFYVQALSLDTGEVNSTAFAQPGRPPPGDGTDPYWLYTAPLMTLGPSLVVSRDAFSLVWYDVSVPGVRSGRWTFPEVEERVDRARPLPARNRQLEHVMPAWSPTHGTVAYPVTYLNMMVVAQCPEENGGRFILAFAEPPPAGYRGTHVLYRENGELLVHRGGLYVIAPTGDLLRSRGLPVDSTPLGYAAGCGLLYQTSEGVAWMDVDTMEFSPALPLPEGAGALALADCGLLVAGRDVEGTRYAPSGRRVRLAAANTSVTPLANGLFAVYLRDSREFSIVDGEGVETLRFALEGPAAPPGLMSWTPDGDFIFDDALFEVGLAPAPPLTISSGLNWAHTNSPLPQ